MADGRIEIIDGKARRRRWSAAEKLRIVAETHERGATVRAVAARHDVYPSLLRTWRRQARDGHFAPEPAAQLVPERLSDLPPALPPLVTEPVGSRLIEVVLPDGVRLRLGSEISTAALRRVIAVLRG